MSDQSTVRLKRDCSSVQIPAGTPVTLREGTEVFITQELGGTFTVHAFGGLYRIIGEDADALGRTTPSHEDGADGAAPADGGQYDEKLVWEALQSCYDPEIPVNIVDLGLIYDLSSDVLENGEMKVAVKMTLTAPGCGMGSVIAGEAQQKILTLPGVKDALVEIVWDPPWHQSMITPEGRKILGLE